jgi:uncharacterized membrane protein
MIIDIIRIVLGLLLGLFIPGLILVMVFFRELNLLEKLSLAVVFSMMISISIAVYLGYNAEQAAITGGLVFENIIRLQVMVVAILSILYMLMFMKNRLKKKNEKGISWF